MQHAFTAYPITKADVNEQHETARPFYERFGFTVKSRSLADGTGRPYPILHMEL